MVHIQKTKVPNAKGERILVIRITALNLILIKEFLNYGPCIICLKKFQALEFKLIHILRNIWKNYMFIQHKFFFQF